MWNGLVSLLAHKSSEFYILPATKIPKNPSGGSSAPWKSYPPGRRNFPNTAEISYVICANSRATEIDLPSDHEFQEKMAQSMNVKDKFSLLKDAKPDRFYNIIGEVIKVHASSGSLTVYLSDYTANSLFYHYVWGEGRDNNDGREGDEYGYIRPKKKATTDWPGPYGKMSIQLTLYDEHAEFVRENVEVHTWVLLNNVKIKYGKMGGLLEGFMHGDQGKVGVKVMKQAAEPGMTDTRWMEAVKRKHNWWKKFKEQQKDLLDEAAGLGDKRKYNGEEPSKNGKKRRREKRAALEKKAAAAEARAMEQLDLNENSKQAVVLSVQVLTANQFGATLQTNPS
jgi:protection-of-telomeres protein 1